MRAAWRLATSSLSARPSRTVLLTIAVALAATLIAAVACAMNSIHASVRLQLDEQVGTAEARIRAGGGRVIPPEVRDRAESWPGAERVTGWLQDTLSLALRTSTLQPDEAGAFSPGDAVFKASALAIAFEPEEFERPRVRPAAVPGGPLGAPR